MVLHNTYGEDNLFSVSHCKSSRLAGNPRRIQSLPGMITTVTGIQIPHHSSEVIPIANSRALLRTLLRTRVRSLSVI